MKIRQYRPAFFSGFENYEGEVGSVTELEALEFLQGIQSDPAFYRFSLHRHYGGAHMLLAELEHGYKWWVMGFLEGPDLARFAELPEWNPNPKLSAPPTTKPEKPEPDPDQDEALEPEPEEQEAP
jgi:hypothetical protein